MKYYAFALKFMTPVHFGDNAIGGKLEKNSLTCSADTFFSAVCNEAARSDAALLGELVDALKSGSIKHSSLFPYFINGDELELYLPKPLYRNEKKKALAATYDAVKEQATKLKAMKKTSYVRVSHLGKLFSDIAEGDLETFKSPQFAVNMLVTRVNKRNEEPLPYYVGANVFNKDAGLYFVLGLEQEELLPKVTELIESLGLEGIGGKRSSGYGKYELLTSPIPVEASAEYDDICSLYTMLLADDAKYQICIASQSPAKGQAAVLKNGFYKLLRRSGFVNSLELEENVKYSSYYLISEGSVFKERLVGQVLELEVPGLSYDIVRNGVGMYVGVNVNE